MKREGKEQIHRENKIAWLHKLILLLDILRVAFVLFNANFYYTELTEIGISESVLNAFHPFDTSRGKCSFETISYLSPFPNLIHPTLPTSSPKYDQILTDSLKVLIDSFPIICVQYVGFKKIRSPNLSSNIIAQETDRILTRANSSTAFRPAKPRRQAGGLPFPSRSSVCISRSCSGSIDLSEPSR